MSTDLTPVVKPIFGQKIICEAKNSDQIDAALLMVNEGSKTRAFTSSKKILESLKDAIAVLGRFRNFRRILKDAIAL